MHSTEEIREWRKLWDDMRVIGDRIFYYPFKPCITAASIIFLNCADLCSSLLPKQYQITSKAPFE